MMTTQNETLPTERKPLDMRRFLDDWVMLLAAIGIFVACTLLIDNFLSPLNMRGWAGDFHHRHRRVHHALLHGVRALRPLGRLSDRLCRRGRGGGDA